MAFRSLVSLVRGSMRARSCSFSPEVTVQGSLGSAAWSALHGPRIALFHGRNDPVAAAGLSVFAGSRGVHSKASGASGRGALQFQLRGAHRFHDRLMDFVVYHADVAFATLSVTFFSVFYGIVYVMKDTYELAKAQKEDKSTTDPFFRSHQLLEEVRRERESYNKAVPDKEALVQEYMEDDQAMRAQFEEWMKKYGRTYQDDMEKARRFKIFKSVARFADASNSDAEKAGQSLRLGVNQFSDWNAEEIALLHGIPDMRNGGYLQMILSYLGAQEIWHEVSIGNKKK